MQNITWHEQKVTKEHKEVLLNQKACVLWLTGLSGSGKSTIAVELEKKLNKQYRYTALLDGDNIRHGLCSDLGFSVEDRQENLRRIREVAKLFYDNGAIAIVSFISPFKEDRALARKLIGKNFIEIFVDCNIDVCKKRDPKGLYEKAAKGEIKGFTGIDQEYQKPEKPEITIDTEKMSVEESVEKIIGYMYGSPGIN